MSKCLCVNPGKEEPRIAVIIAFVQKNKYKIIEILANYCCKMERNRL